MIESRVYVVPHDSNALLLATALSLHWILNTVHLRLTVYVAVQSKKVQNEDDIIEQ